MNNNNNYYYYCDNCNDNDIIKRNPSDSLLKLNN